MLSNLLSLTSATRKPNSKSLVQPVQVPHADRIAPQRLGRNSDGGVVLSGFKLLNTPEAAFQD